MSQEDYRIKLQKIMNEATYQQINADTLTTEQRKILYEWGLKMFGLGQHVTGYIQEIKYDGRLIILDDGSRWAVPSFDAHISEYWTLFSDVVVIDNKMFLFSDEESVDVEQEM